MEASTMNVYFVIVYMCTFSPEPSIINYVAYVNFKLLG